MTFWKPTTVLVGALCSAGCAVLSMVGDPKPECREIKAGYFPATKTDIYGIKKLNNEDASIPLRIVGTPLLIVDLPISLCYDILDAPFKCIKRVNRKPLASHRLPTGCVRKSADREAVGL